MGTKMCYSITVSRIFILFHITVHLLIMRKHLELNTGINQKIFDLHSLKLLIF